MTLTGLRKPSMPASWRRHKEVPRFYMNLRHHDYLFGGDEEIIPPRNMHRLLDAARVLRPTRKEQHTGKALTRG